MRPTPRSRRHRLIAAGVIVMLAAPVLLRPAPAAEAPRTSKGEAVAFRSLDPTLTALVPGTLYAPEGPGPFHAVVLLHGCSGIGASTDGWAVWLAAHGYAALVVDSMAPREVRSVCVVGGRPTMADQSRDAYGALAYLRSRATVTPARIGVMGWSHGGGATLDAVNRRYAAQTPPAAGGFKAAVALYPPCSLFPADGITAPLLMLLGGDDDWTPPAVCESSAPNLQKHGAPLEWHVYPGATHAFDTPAPDRVLHIAGRTFHLRHDPAATADAHARVLAFFGEHLK